MNRPLTAILADDHAIVREGLKLLFSAVDNIAIVAEAADGEEKRLFDRMASLMSAAHGAPSDD